MYYLSSKTFALIAWHIIITISALVIFSAAITPVPAHAGLALLSQDQCDGLAAGNLGFLCPDRANANAATITDRLLSYILALILLPATVIAAGALVYGAAQYILARGDEEAVRRAKNTVVYSVLGLIIIGIAGFLINAFINVV